MSNKVSYSFTTSSRPSEQEPGSELEMKFHRLMTRPSGLAVVHGLGHTILAINPPTRNQIPAIERWLAAPFANGQPTSGAGIYKGEKTYDSLHNLHANSRLAWQQVQPEVSGIAADMHLEEIRKQGEETTKSGLIIVTGPPISEFKDYVANPEEIHVINLVTTEVSAALDQPQEPLPGNYL